MTQEVAVDERGYHHRGWTSRNSPDAMPQQGPDGHLPTQTLDQKRGAAHGYDSQGRLTTVTAGGITQTSTYDAAGNVTNVDDGRGGSVASTYDTAGRLGVETVRNGSTVLATRTYGYGENGETRGLLTSITDSTVGAITATYDADGALATQTLPDSSDPTHPITATYTRDTQGSLSTLTWSQGANTWFADDVSRNAQDQITSDSNGATKTMTVYGYDAVGRLTSSATTQAGACTSAQYAYDINSDRTSSSSYPTAPDGSCQTTTVDTTRSVNFDAAGRPTIAGQQIDAWGRTTLTPAGYTATRTALSTGFYVDDMLATSSSAGTDRTWSRDASARPACQRSAPTGTTDPASCGSPTVAGVTDETLHYLAKDDQPGWSQTRSGGTSTITRYVSGLDGQLAVVVTGTAVAYQLGDLHGDIVATTTPAATAAWDGQVISSDEFGQTQTSDAGGNSADNPRYGWLGGRQRAADGQAGTMLMGARVYNPATGLFLSEDPMDGSSNARYGYPADPVNQFDLDGRMTSGSGSLELDDTCEYFRSLHQVPSFCQHWQWVKVVTGHKKYYQIGKEGEAIGRAIIRSWLHRIHAARATIKRQAYVKDVITATGKRRRFYDFRVIVFSWTHYFEIKANGAQLSPNQRAVDPVVNAYPNTSVHLIRVAVDPDKYHYERVCSNCDLVPPS